MIISALCRRGNLFALMFKEALAKSVNSVLSKFGNHFQINQNVFDSHTLQENVILWTPKSIKDINGVTNCALDTV